MIATCIRALPNEGCGLLVGDGTSLHDVIASPNVADSAKVYEIDPKVMLRAMRESASAGLEIIGVFHSHTHSDPYPSPTDVAQAPDPSWHYVIVSLRNSEPMVRSFSVANGVVSEEEIKVQ